MEFKYTKHQTARRSRPDAEVGEKIYLIKSPSKLFLTYQIKLLTYMAAQRKKKLVLRAPKTTVFDDTLRSFIKENKNLILVERT